MPAGSKWSLQLLLRLAAAIVAFSLTDFYLRRQGSFQRFWAVKPVRNAAIFSRYHVPWEIVEKISLPTLVESRGNILYSAISLKASDGIGHAMATFNAEVFAAYNLGLTYSHRVATFGSLTNQDNLAVEKFFGLGDGELTRTSLQEVICDIPDEKMDINCQDKKGKRICPICNKMRTQLGMRSVLNDIITLPKVVSGPAGNIPRLRQLCSGVTSTLFTMDIEDCDKLPAQSDFSVTGSIFYWKYWYRHGVNKYGGPLRKPRPGLDHEMRQISYNDKELSIGIHIRRGDFLDPNSTRVPTSSGVFVAIVSEILRHVRHTGGGFATLRPAIHIYSEGVKKKKGQSKGSAGSHDISSYDPIYVDFNGKKQPVEWWQEQLFPTTLNEGNDGPYFLPRVIMHVAEQTLPSLHDMASADIFIGSLSGFSKNVIRSIGRGTMILPCKCWK